MNRRSFLKFIGVGGAVLAAPIFEPQADVRGWRFGVWTILSRYRIRNGQQYYWCRCDCEAERAVGLRQLLSVDALSCDHVRARGVFSINPEHVYCVCGEKRRFFFNGRGFRIFRCGECEQGDIRAYLRYEYGPATSRQFLRNTRYVERIKRRYRPLPFERPAFVKNRD